MEKHVMYVSVWIGLPMEKLVTHHFPLEKIGEALETNVQMKGIKVAVVVE